MNNQKNLLRAQRSLLWIPDTGFQKKIRRREVKVVRKRGLNNSSNLRRRRIARIFVSVEVDFRKDSLTNMERNAITSFNPSKKHSEPERWICIYPAYLDSTKTLKQGRKVPKDKAVDTPRLQDILDVLKATKFPVYCERKRYPRETSREQEHLGRIRFQLKNDDGTPLNPQFITRDSILLYLGGKIPQLKSRQGPSAAPEQISVSKPQPPSKKKKGGRR
ncbi:signal recognition particle 19 kDa protein-like [Artemia franciscana]|uniref:Signal recognition particle 19 kDa protein n=1 Tax=Artemia franciscana TaxID=6661 RepID=A0AA88LFY0_ARTSF|nr:hypothetical protein QYM36_001629 [Artemia franciscana]